jgi:glc operon protein GlcG
MCRSVASVFAICGAVLIGSAALAQQPASPPPPPLPLYGPTITTEQAKKAVAAALVEAKKMPYLYVFAVVDPNGDLVYFEQMDSAPTSSKNIAIGKAYTAATFKRPSKFYWDLTESGHSFPARLDPRMVLSPGGVPIIVDGKVVGAIGVSGGANGLFDMAAAQAGADALK